MDVQAPGDGVAVLAGFCLLALVAVVWGTIVALRDRDRSAALAVLGATCVGALFAVLCEPIFDLLGKIYYPENHATAFTAFERPIPAFLLAGYVPFVAVLPFLISLRMRDGVTSRALYGLAFGSFVAVAAIETVGTATDNWIYYGESPLKWLGVAPQMAAVPIVCAWLILTLGRRLRGAARLLLVAVPPASLASVYAAAGWPIYVALYSDTPAGVSWLAGAATLGLCAGIVWAVGSEVGRPVGASGAEGERERLGSVLALDHAIGQPRVVGRDRQ